MNWVRLLTLACTPLAALAVWSFVELRSIDQRFARTTTSIDPAAINEAVQNARNAVEASRASMGKLAASDLLIAEKIPELARLPEAMPLQALSVSWSRWSETRGVIGEVVAAEQTASRNDANSMGAAARQMEQLKTKLEVARQPSNAPLLPLLQGRIAALRTGVGQREQESQSASLRNQAAEALKSGRFDEAAKLCGQWMSKYGQGPDADAAAQVRALKRRAEFHVERERASTRMKTVAGPSEQAAILGDFLKRFPDSPDWSAGERSVLERCRETQRQLSEKAKASEQCRGAAAEVASLRGKLPPGILPRLSAAAAIVEKRPSSQVRPMVRQEAVRWIEELLPEKRLNEDPLLQEAETKDHHMLRGFFLKVATPSGEIGYKRYDTLDEFQHPSADVGTFPAGDFGERPGPSLLRRSASQYNDARRRLLVDPGRKQGWIELAALCRALDSQLAQYRKKPGASTEPLSFAAEAKLMEEVLADAGWRIVEKVWSP